MDDSKASSNLLRNVGATPRGPRAFYDVDSIEINDDRTGYIHRHLEKWSNATCWRGNKGEKARQVVLKSFMKEDSTQIQPSWARQWIILVYCSSEEGILDQAPHLAKPTKDKHETLLRYFTQLRLDVEDCGEEALRIINNSRKQYGVGWTLEYGEDRWGALETDSSECMATDVNDAELGDDDVMMAKDGYVIQQLEGSAVTDLGDVGIASDSEALRPELGFGQLLEGVSRGEPTGANLLTKGVMSAPSIHRTDDARPPVLKRVGRSIPSNCQPDSPPDFVSPSRNSSDLVHGVDIVPQDLPQSDTYDTPSTLDEIPSPITAASPNITQPIGNAILPGPRAVCDLDAIIDSQDSFGADYIMHYLLQWKNASGDDIGPQRRRSGHSKKRMELEKRKIRIVKSFMKEDDEQDQPSWASQWISLISSEPDSGAWASNTSNMAHRDSQDLYKLVLEFFSLLLDGGKDAKGKAIQLLNRERKRMGFGWTLEVKKGITMEFSNPKPIMAHRLKKGPSRANRKSAVSSRQDEISMALDPQTTTDTSISIAAESSHQIPGSNSLVVETSCDQQSQNSSQAPSVLDAGPPVDQTTSSAPADLESPFSPMFRSIRQPEPGLSGRIHIWARSRVELCETTPYFRSFQGGIHVDSRSRMMGYLLDGHPSPGDLWARDGRFIISHGGGSSASTTKSTGGAFEGTSNDKYKRRKAKANTSERRVLSSSVIFPRNVADSFTPFGPKPKVPKKSSSKSTSKRCLERDQSPDHINIGRLLDAYDNQTPIVLLVGANYRWWPLLMKDVGSDAELLDEGDERRGRYAVLGWYIVRDAWEELEPGKAESRRLSNGTTISETRLFTRWKFTFEWIEAQGIPWWISDLQAAAKQFSDTDCDVGQSGELVEGIKYYTGINSPILDPASPEQEVLDCPDSMGRASNECKAPLISTATHPAARDYDAGRLQMCAECEQESPRVYHDCWFCMNSACDLFSMLLDGRFSTELTLSYSHDFVTRPPLPTSHLTEGMAQFGTEFLDTSEDPWSVVPTYRDDLDSYTREHWQGRCCVCCGRLNSKVEWGRWICPTCHHIVEEAPLTVYQLDQCMTWSPKRPRPDWGDYGIVKIGQNHLNYDDGASLHSFTLPDAGTVYLFRPQRSPLVDEMFSGYQGMGAKLRRLRLKIAPVTGTYTSHFSHNAGKHYNFSCDVQTEAFEEAPKVVRDAKNHLAIQASSVLGRPVEFNEVLSCAYKEDQSMHFHSDDELGVQGTIAAISLGAPATMSFRSKTKTKVSKNARVCLDLILRHGDVLIMDGLNIQKNYQHRVIPHGLRFAATARLINEEESGTKRRYKRRKDPIEPESANPGPNSISPISPEIVTPQDGLDATNSLGMEVTEESTPGPNAMVSNYIFVTPPLDSRLPEPMLEVEQASVTAGTPPAPIERLATHPELQGDFPPSTLVQSIPPKSSKPVLACPISHNKAEIETRLRHRLSQFNLSEANATPLWPRGVAFNPVLDEALDTETRAQLDALTKRADRLYYPPSSTMLPEEFKKFKHLVLAILVTGAVPEDLAKGEIDRENLVVALQELGLRLPGDINRPTKNWREEASNSYKVSLPPRRDEDFFAFEETSHTDMEPMDKMETEPMNEVAAEETMEVDGVQPSLCTPPIGQPTQDDGWEGATAEDMSIDDDVIMMDIEDPNEENTKRL